MRRGYCSICDLAECACEQLSAARSFGAEQERDAILAWLRRPELFNVSEHLMRQIERTTAYVKWLAPSTACKHCGAAYGTDHMILCPMMRAEEDET